MTLELESAFAPVSGTLNAAASFFTVMALGYMLRQYRVLGPEAGAVIGKVAGTVALPAATFVAMSSFSLGEIDWPVVGAVALGKAATWVLGAAVGAALGMRAGNSVTMAGIVSLFATCSNDTVFGLPIFEAVLPHTVPFVHSATPVQLLLFNPLSMVVIALGQDARDASGKRVPLGPKLGGVAFSVVTNPLLLATVLGLAASHFGVQLPVFVTTALQKTGAALPLCAFASLGMAFAGNLSSVVDPSTLAASLLLVATKLGAAPLATVAADRFLGAGRNKAFAMIYGAIPTAPSPYLVAVAMNAASGLVGAATVHGMLGSVPVLVALICANDASGNTAEAVRAKVGQAAAQAAELATDEDNVTVVMAAAVALATAVAFGLSVGRSSPADGGSGGEEHEAGSAGVAEDSGADATAPEAESVRRRLEDQLVSDDEEDGEEEQDEPGQGEEAKEAVEDRGTEDKPAGLRAGRGAARSTNTAKQKAPKAAEPGDRRRKASPRATLAEELYAAEAMPLARRRSRRTTRAPQRMSPQM